MENNDKLIKKIIHQIRNIQSLDNKTLESINKFSCDDKMLIIIEYNIVLERMNQIIEANT